jgi:hypothetical protein
MPIGRRGDSTIRGIGPVYAKKLVRAFGEKVFDTRACPMDTSNSTQIYTTLTDVTRLARVVPRGTTLARRGLPLQAEKVHSDACEPADPGHVGWEMLAQMAIPTLGTRTI